MTPERWGKIERLFHAALAHEPAERPGFLGRECAGDAALRREVETLLTSYGQAGDFIEAPASDVAAALLEEDRLGPETGQMVGPFRVAEVLARGGMGEVYLAEDMRLGRKVALKLLPPQFTADPDRVRRFGQEARAASALNHPNIVTIHEIGEADALHYIATEFVEGETLREHMASTRMTVGEVLDVAAQVASALSAAHEAGIVHRDVKPENIMLRRDRLVKVLDFGLAKLASPQALAVDQRAPTESRVKTNPGVVMGTVGYMSPEQARGLEVDARTDIWSLGVVLYEMATGRAPFEGETPSHVIVSVLEREPPPLSRDAAVPAELERVVAKALCKDRAERYQTAGELAHDLKSLKEELTVESRLKQFGRPDADGRETATKSGRLLALNTSRAPATSAAGVAIAHLTSTAEYLTNGIRRHRGATFFASATVVLMVMSLVYFSNFTISGGEAIDSVAVLPFVNVGGDPNAEFLSDGVSDSVINSLSQLPNLKRVISFNSVLHYKGKEVDPQEVGRELNVRAVLMGRLTLRGDEVVVSTELVDVQDRKRLWGGQYDRRLADVLPLQGEIAREISERLRLKLTGEEKRRLTKSSTTNPEAYELYMLGRFHRRNRAGNEKARDYLEQAITKDPNYAPAYAQLAYTYSSANVSDWFNRKEARERMERAARRALELDETLGDAHAALALTAVDWSIRSREFQRALELDPNSADVHAFHARGLWGRRRLDEAIFHMKRAVELDPLSPALQADLGKILYSAGRREQALEQYRKALDLNPNYFGAYHNLARFYLGEGRYQEAIAAAEKFSANIISQGSGKSFLGYTYAVAGKRAEAEKILQELEEESKQRRVNPESFALIYTGLGDKDRAFEFLRKEIEVNNRLSSFINVHPEWDSLRTDPRWEELIRQSEFHR